MFSKKLTLKEQGTLDFLVGILDYFQIRLLGIPDGIIWRIYEVRKPQL